MNNQAIKRKVPRYIDRVVFDRIYFIKLKRIAKGISQEELSFLIGRPKNFVSRAEAFMPGADYYTPDLNRLGEFFNCATDEFNRGKNQTPDYIKVRATEERKGERIYFEAEQLHDDGSTQMLFKLEEVIPKCITNANLHEQNKLRAKQVLAKLLAGDYLKEQKRKPLEIYLQCLSLLENEILPQYIEMALAQYMKPNSSPRILKITQTGYGYTYKKVEDEVPAPIVESLDEQL